MSRALPYCQPQGDGNGYHDNGYDKLDGDWLTYYKVAKGFVKRVRPEDRQDFLHDLLFTMHKVKATFPHLFLGGGLSFLWWLCITHSPCQSGNDELVEADIFALGLQCQGFM